jgi:hypothetical protein
VSVFIAASAPRVILPTPSSGCHGMVTVNPAMAYRNGWSVRGVVLPSQTPVRRLNELVYLHDDGAIIPVTTPPVKLGLVMP